MATDQATKTQIEELSPAEAKSEIDAGGVALVDTREPHEYEESSHRGWPPGSAPTST